MHILIKHLIFQIKLSINQNFKFKHGSSKNDSDASKNDYCNELGNCNVENVNAVENNDDINNSYDTVNDECIDSDDSKCNDCDNIHEKTIDKNNKCDRDENVSKDTEVYFIYYYFLRSKIIDL